jgi:transportin-1
VQRWTVRRASASALDSLAEVYGDALLPVILPELQARLSAAGDSDAAWRAREVGVLALGAISTGCLDAMAGHAPQLWPLLVGLASGDARPLVRSIALWALSRYVPWLMEMQLLEDAPDADDEADGGGGASGGGPAAGGECAKYCDALFGAIAARLGDGNRKVQQAVCAALVHICGEAPDLVSPYARRLVPLLGAAVGRYGAVSRVAAYDVIGALADGAGSELASPEVAAALLPPLMERYRCLKDVDPELPPLLEAVGYLFTAMGPLLAEAAPPLFARCVALIEHDIVMAMAAAQEQDAADAAGHTTVGGGLGGRGYADYPLAVVALDTLGGIVEGLGASAAPLVASAGGDRLHGLLLECIKQPPPGVRMSSFALLGELAKHAPGWLAPRAGGYVPFAAVSMRDTPMNLKACNNAIWAVGEMAVVLPAAVAPHAPAVLERLGAVITNDRKPSRPLLENAAVALGRLALAAPAAVAGALPAFCAAWTQCLTFVSDPVERAQAYAGYAAAVERNPTPGLPLLGHMVVAFAVYADAPPDVRAATAAVLRGYQTSAPAQWAEAVGRLSPQARERAAQLFGPAGVRFR